MTRARTFTAAVNGITGHLVEMEADIVGGLPATIMAGLPDTVLREARDRIRAAVLNSGEHWPQAKISISLSPASLPKRGSAYDLAIAIAIVAANGELPEPLPDKTMFLAELGLDGQLRPVPGVLPAVLAGVAADVDTVVVAAQDAADAALVPGVTVIAANALAEVVAWLRGGPVPNPKLTPRADPAPAGTGSR
jgi:magnesium chelatase family protein